MEKSKRKPPSFRHLPQERGVYSNRYPSLRARAYYYYVKAKKLKKEWVIKQKIKSKWKSQKRREGIRSQPDTSIQITQPSSLRKERSVSTDDAGIDDGDQVQQSSDDEPATSSSVQRNEQRPREQETNAHSDGLSLRELQRQAHSPASLHHYKSRPLRHPKNRTASNDVTIRRREATIGAPMRSRGGGQPNMRLRMTAMLEKIRRDCS
jgi:hypothetical protein